MAGLKNMMIIEDDVMIRDLYRAALVDGGYNVQTAGSAEELYQKLVNYHPDCLFLDIMLPDVSGLEILKELKSNPAHGCQNAKVVILTNLAQRSVADSAMNNGAEGYIIKADILPKDLPRVVSSLEED